MPMEEDPEVGAVYEDAEGRRFEVRAIDEENDAVELEYYPDGKREIIDLETWYELDLTLLESPAESEDEETEEDYEGRDAYLGEDEDYDDEEE